MLVVLGGVVLRERDAARRLDLLEPERAVGGGAREDHADGLVALLLGERAQEVVDRAVLRRATSSRGESWSSRRATIIEALPGGIT